VTGLDNDSTAQAIFHQLQTLSQTDGFGQRVLLSSAHSASGTSFVARSIAMAAAAHYTPLGQRVLLLDYDIYKQSQLEAVMQMGPVNGPYDMSFGVTPFWQVRAGILDDSPELPAATYGSLYLQNESGLAVSVFRWDQIGSNQSVKVINTPDYWEALNHNFAMVIVDGPALDRTNMSAVLYPHMDATAIVATSQIARSPQTLQMAQDIQTFGGHFAGLILNDNTNGLG